MGGVKPFALKALEARQLRDVGTGKLTAGTDQHFGFDGFSIGEIESPPPRRIIESRANDIRFDSQAFIEPESPHDAQKIRLNLVSRRKASGPFRVRSERKRVHDRRDIAGNAGVCVRAPHAARPIAPLQHHEVILPSAEERMGSGNTTKPSPDNGRTDLA
jgi:hypothetical protein